MKYKYIFTLFFQINLSHSFYPKTALSKISIHHLRNKFKNHQKIGYKKSRQILFKHFKHLIIYGDSNDEEMKNINCEHIWCQKYFNYQEPMKSDLHILYLSNSKLNSHRNDFKFSDIYLNYTNIDIQGNKINMSHSSPFNIIYKKNTNKKIFYFRINRYFIIEKIWPQYIIKKSSRERTNCKCNKNCSRNFF